MLPRETKFLQGIIAVPRSASSARRASGRQDTLTSDGEGETGMSDDPGMTRRWQQRFEVEYRRMHEARRRSLGNDSNAVVVRLDDDLHLLHAGHQHSVRINADDYHRMKAIAHMAAATVIGLANADRGSLPVP